MHFTSSGAPTTGSDGNSGIHLDMWDPFELVERCWFFCSCLKTEFVDPKFRLMVVVDARAAQYFPRWLFDGKAFVFFDGQTSCHLRPWFESLVGNMKPMEHHRLEVARQAGL